MQRKSRAPLLTAVVATLVTAGVVLACSSSTSPTSLAGTYNLSTINGQSLPVVVDTSQGATTSLTSGHVTLTSNTYAFAANFSVLLQGQTIMQTAGDTGTYSVSGSALTLVSNSLTDTTTATVNGNSITVTDVSVIGGGSGSGFTLIFTKQ